jgi:hypothetical protein
MATKVSLFRVAWSGKPEDYPPLEICKALETLPEEIKCEIYKAALQTPPDKPVVVARRHRTGNIMFQFIPK